MKIMRIKIELIRIAGVHTETGLTAIRIECAFSQSTCIGGLKPVWDQSSYYVVLRVCCYICALTFDKQINETLGINQWLAA